MVETGGDGLEQLYNRLAELSERQASHARDVVEAIAKRRLEARQRGMNFAAASADKILERMKAGRTPFLYGAAWNYRTPAAGTLSVAVGVDNPDPVQQSFLYVHLFVGPGNLAPDAVDGISLVDQRFPRATEPEFAGLFMSPFSETTLGFELPLSGRLEETHYFGNLFLIQQNPFALPGQVLDRVSFVFKVHD
jgi:hypothetical protein